MTTTTWSWSPTKQSVHCTRCFCGEEALLVSSRLFMWAGRCWKSLATYRRSRWCIGRSVWRLFTCRWWDKIAQPLFKLKWVCLAQLPRLINYLGTHWQVHCSHQRWHPGKAMLMIVTTGHLAVLFTSCWRVLKQSKSLMAFLKLRAYQRKRVT